MRGRGMARQAPAAARPDVVPVSFRCRLSRKRSGENCNTEIGRSQRGTQPGRDRPEMPVPRSRLRSVTLALILPLLSWLAATGPASAHRPYFTEAQPILLPDGQRGEMRIIAGDGIVVADPVRIIILDAESRLIARGPKTLLLSLVCDAPLRCHGYDHSSGEIIEPDPMTFGQKGSHVPPFSERDNLWDIEDGEATWGVKVRPASWVEWLLAEWSQWRGTSPLAYGLFVSLGLIAGFSSVGLHNPKPTLSGKLLWLAEMLLRLCGLGIALVAMSLALVIGGARPTVMFGVILVAYVAPWGAWLLLRRRSKTSVVAA